MMKKLNPARLIVYPVLLIAVTLLFKDQIVSAITPHNGFDLTDSLIDINEIHHGGPVKDGIPAIDKPLFVTPEQADFIKNSDRVLGLAINGIAKAYPINILNYHEIINDFFQQQAVVITYCPLCGSGIAYSANINGQNSTFGVSGLLYNSDVLLYDRATDSLWSQLLSKAISGKLKGVELEMLNLTHTSWQAWQEQYPQTLILSDKTGYKRDYSHSPYGNYEQSQSLYFPVKKLNLEYHPKEYVLGLKLSGKQKVYPFAQLAKLKSPYKDSFAGKEVTIIFDAENRTGKIFDNTHRVIPSVTSFWFAWMAFYPDSEIFSVSE